jgi:hypothetical protein
MESVRQAIAELFSSSTLVTSYSYKLASGVSCACVDNKAELDVIYVSPSILDR